MMALAGGGGLYVTAGLSRRKFMNWLVDHQIDMAWIDEGMLDLPESEADRKLALKKAPVSAMPPSLHEPLERRFGLRAREVYASTEVGNGTFVPYERTDTVGTGSMGWCFPRRESKIIDQNGEEVEPGRSGELCLRGPGMMLGYHNRPEANAELFLPGGWFRTGDIVRKDADGQHYYEGRVRDVIRRSGENIAAAEVELQIMSMPEVEEVGVIPVPDPQRDEEVKAVVVLKPGASLTAQEIEAWCLRGLARFKVPRYIEFRESLPHTASGKIAKAELRAEPHRVHAVDLRAS
jgi:acyl-coenzyme A synthetase/AMP-(fatty) acid ligase